eukprot:GILI01027760.1.p1 GENE.GILI01027760.1~~GILI01027760.1.p1  ORF type:complete len:329 (-),score=45.87 GILI01027760.1:27-1013(-)
MTGNTNGREDKSGKNSKNGQNGHNSNLLFLYMTAGASSGAVSALLTAPLDLLKTRLQVQKETVNPKYKGMIDGFKVIFKEEGARGLYSGLGPTLLGLIPNWAVYFTSYSWLKSYISNLTGSDPVTNHWVHISSSMGAGCITAGATNPIWVVKVRMQTQSTLMHPDHHYTGIIDCFRRIKREEGMKGFYRGLGPSLIGVSHVMIQFPMYEKIKNTFEKSSGQSATITQMVVASAVSKAIASSITYPHEVLRSRFQQHPNVSISDSSCSATSHSRSMLTSIRSILGQEGLQGLYKGMGTNLVKVTPTAVVTVVAYDVIYSKLVSWYDKGQ